ncbi:carbohydrate-binding protein [Vreelandella andesensis]|uniref:Carbohydrate-binding protein n=2 Tax=Vreelandella andesensis TaxID=447567 RepID=A0A433KS76_9GAMM|nr:carbohydrate-binding protein [Halomonas andesensis]
MFDLPSTTPSDSTDFNEFGERTIRVQLEAGENTVTFSSNGAGGPSVDYLEVRAPDPDVYVIQGEELALEPAIDNKNGATNRVVTLDNITDFTNGTEIFRVGAEGASYLDWAFGNASAHGEFTLDVATAGTYSVTVTYASSSERPLDLSLVEGSELTTLGTFDFATTIAPVYYPDDVSDVPAANLPSGPSQWEGWSTETMEITLAAGTNTLRLGGYSNGPNIDKIEVSLLSADPVDPSQPTIDAIVVQAENAELAASNDAGTLVRDAENPETSAGFQGLRPDYSGTGYVDFGSAPGDSLTFTVNVAEAGEYDLNFRYASNGSRPLDLTVNGNAASLLAFDTTDPDGNGLEEGFDNWGYQTLTTALAVGDNTITLSIPAGANRGPNIDRLEVTTAGTGPVGDVQADADATPLVFSADSTMIDGTNVNEAGFSVTGLDDDIVSVGVSFDGGVTVEEVTPNSDGSFVLDLSGQDDGDLSATLIAMDAFGNRAEQTLDLTLDTTVDETGPVALDITFDDATITPYNETQDNPASGTGAAVEDDGATLTLNDNVWKRADLPSSYTITGDTLLTLDLAISSSPEPEIVAIGFDADSNPFNGGDSLYQLGGTQTQGGFIDLRGQGVDNGDGTFRFTIDLSAHAGTTLDSLVYINDDDLGEKGSASFSAVSLSENEVDDTDTNSAPRVVGGGIADLSLDEGSNIEVDLPFVDDDGDTLSFSVDITDSDGQPVTVAGLSVEGQVLSGNLGGLAPGNYTVSVTADDGTASTSTEFALTVENINGAPVAEPAALEPYFGEVGESFIQIPLADFASLFSDPDGDSLTLSAEDLPAGLDVVDGIIQGIPSQGGAFDVVIRATDPDGLSATLALSFVIEGTQIGDSITIEAENFTDLNADNLIVTGNAFASNEQLIRLTSNTPATIGTDLLAGGVEPGWYTARLYVFDETDGEGELTLTIGDTTLQARNAASDTLSSAVVLSDDFGTIVGSGPRGNAGQSGNRKEIVFETPFEVTAGDLASLELRGAGGELMRIDSLVLDRIEEPTNAAPTLEGLAADVSVDENSATVASLIVDDADGDSLTVTLSGADAALFIYDEMSGELAFINPPDAELAADSDEDGVYELTVTVSDGKDSVSQNTLITVKDLNERLVINQTVFSVDENLTEIGAIPIVDEDGVTTGLNAPMFAITGGVDAPLFTINETTGVLSFTSARDFELPVDDDEDGVYEVEVTVTDGDLSDVQTLAVTVNDVDETAFSPISLQAEDGVLTILDDGSNANVTTVRDANNPETGSGFSGLRPDYSGTGYVDFGDTAGDAITFAFTVPEAGSYDLNVRYASNTTRPLNLSVNGGDATELPFASTDPDGSGVEEGFNHWLFETVTVTLEAGDNTLSLAIPPGANTGPNIDRIEITEAGSGPITEDTSADEDGNLTLTAADDMLDAGQLATAMFNIAGADDDIVTYEISLDGGTTRTLVTPDINGDIAVDLTGQSGDVSVTLIVTDAVGNEAQASDSVTIDEGDTGPAPFSFVIEGEALTLFDTDNVGDTLDTQVRDANNPETNISAGADGLWDGYSGTGYLDMGGDTGDAAAFDVEVDEAGTYTLTVRYANAGGNGADRPMDILVGGESQGSLDFASTGVDAAGWENWTETTIEVDLEAGSNTIRLENLNGNGPNIDRLSVSRGGIEPPDVIEPGERFSVKINFEPEGFATPEGYIADNGKAFGAQSVTIDGQTYQYGWVTEASIYDDEPGTTPLDISSLTSVAVNDRTDDIAGLDPRQGTYAHFDQPAANYVRAGWEMELDDGYYEVTIAIGDTSGPYDSVNAINAEGEAFNDVFTPFRPDDFPEDNNPANDTQGFRSDLVTRVVQVTDGRLTLDSLGLGDNTEIQYIEIQSLPDLTPDDDREAPEDYALFNDPRAIAGVGANVIRVELDPQDGSVPVNVDPGSDIFVGISVVDGRGGALLESLDDGSVRLFETVTGEEVSLNVNTTGGFDSLTISPSSMLKEHTSYTLVIDGFQDRGENDNPDAPTRLFQKFTNTFVTGEAQEVVPREVAFSHTVELNGADDNAFQFTSLEISPDGAKMYISNMLGQIKRYDIDPQTGALSDEQVLSLDIFQGDSSGPRGIIGLVFDPTDPNVLWITDNYPIPLTGKDDGVPDFSGRILKITLDEGEAFGATAEPYIIGLPRSSGDHVTNSLEFRANPEYDAAINPDVPTHLLYLVQGSNSAMGAPDSAWGNRPERLLNATVMEIDPTRDAPAGGFDVTTEPLPDDGFNRRFTDDDGENFKADPIAMGNDRFLVFAPNGTATVENSNGDVIESYYDPFAEDAVVKIFATGIRNAYDLVWHSDGNLYVPTNGSAAGGNVPDDPSTPENEYQSNVEKQDDYLFTVEKGGYYGHPNPLRDEFILNGGNPTSGSDPNQVNKYPVGQQPDPNYDIDGVYSLGENRSPNGVIEYTNGVFGGNLQGSVLFTEYSGGDDIRSITFDASGNIIGDEVLRDINGNVITYIDPLDIIENPATGQLYLLTLNRNNGQSQIVRLDPAPGGVIDPVDPVDPQDPINGLVSLLTIQAEDNTPNDGTSVTIAEGSGAQIQIRTSDNPEPNPSLATGLRPGAYGLDGNTDDSDGVLGGYADFGSTNADFLTFNFELSATEAGESVLRVRYANGGSGDRPLEVFVNNISVGTLSFSPPAGLTGDAAWAEWMTLDISAELASGLNTVRFQAINNTGPNIDQLEVLQAPQDATPGYVEYEAEGAVLDGPVIVTAAEDDRNASGDGFVDFDGTGDQSITWTIEVAEAGTYEIGFRYALSATKADRPMVLSVNGNDLESLPFTGQSNVAEDDWYYQTTTVTLKAGTNSITVTAPDANGPNIDLLRVSDEPLDIFEPRYADIDGSGRIELESGDTARALNERTADFYFTVDENGAYKLDLAANSGASNGGQLTLLLNGQQIDAIAFPGAGDAGEESVYIELEAGVSYHLRVISEADGANEIDYLDVSLAPGDPDADIGIQSGDAAYYSDRLHFSYLENNSASNPNRDYKEDGTVTISNTGTSELTFIDVDLDGPFKLANPSIFNGLSLAAGASIAVEVLFDRSAYVPPTSDGGDGVFEGVLRLITNDADTPVAEVHLAGFWQQVDEGGWEPNVNEVWEVFGFGNVIDGLSTLRGGENSVLNDFDLYRPINDDEVMSRYWKIAEGFESAKITQLAAYHGDGGATMGIHNPGNKGQDVIFSNHAGNNNQTLLPIKSNGQFATATFTRDRIPDSWIGNDIFGIEIANLSTDPSLNPSGGGTVPEDAAGIERGYTVRMFQALDANGNVIPNTYLGIMDYTGINYDYNDNMFVIEGISPVSGAEISIINLDGVPSNERLVMSRIEDPANSSQVFHDESTFTITNGGFVNLEISSLEITDPTLFEIVGATENLIIPPSGTLDVTVRFIAKDFDDATLYETSLLINSNDANAGQKVIQLAGLAQGKSESGMEPLVQEIVDAFGFSTNVAESEMNKGGLVEANGDEILSPYFQRADAGSPIKITQLAAYHTQGDVARLYIHDVDSRDIDEVIAHDEQDGQTLLPRALNSGDQLAVTTLDRDAPFGFFADITGREGYISWSDPDANLYEDTIDAIGRPGTNLSWDENDGHLIRVYIAKDADGNVIPNTYLVIQDYAGVNYDYNDNIFLLENVTTYDPTGAEDADGNGRVDLYDDDNNNGVPNFIDNPEPDPEPSEQTAFNDSETPWAVGAEGLALEARFYDNGGQDVAYNDSDSSHQGAAFRSDEAVDISTPSLAIGFIEDGEWVEYTINVAEEGVYDLDFLTSMNSSSPGARSITASFAKGDTPYATASPVGVAPTGSWTNFTQTDTTQVSLEAGEQVLRLTFNGGPMDLASFNLVPVEQAPTNQAPEVGAGINDITLVEGEAIDFSLPGDAFTDADGDSLTYTASGLPDGFSMSLDGVFSGTAATAGSFDIIVTASDGLESVQTAFTLAVEEAPLEDGQQAYTAGGEPWQVSNDFSLAAVNYDEGGQGVAYNDSSEVQLGSNFRGEGVDIVGDGDAIGWVQEGEWVEYTLNIQQSGLYDLSFLSALGNSSGPQRSITATFTKGDGTPYVTTDQVVVSPTGGWRDFQPTDTTQVALEAGEQVLRLTFSGGSQDLASFSLERGGQQPFNADGTPWLVDADDGLALNAVQFDKGKQGEAYNELSSAQLGTNFRDEPVDIVGQGEAIGWVQNGEWVEYTINVEQAGSHTLSFVTSTPNNGRSITASVEQDGVTYDQASASVPNSGAWGTYVDGPSVTMELEEGVQVLRLTFNGGSQDLASFQISRDSDISAASVSNMDMMMAMSTETNDVSTPEEALVALSEDVSISGVQEDGQGVLM